jgi:hypothetical protein
MRRGFVVMAGLSMAACKKTPPPPSPSPEAVVQPTPEPAAAPPRCSPVSKEAPFVLGPTDTGRPIDTNNEDDSLPFAALVGEGVSWAGGFAVGAIHESNASQAMSVVTLDANGHGAKIVSLGVAKGDVEPPRVVAHGAALVAGVLEPELGGRALRLARIADGAVTWGATLHERGGESQAFDIALADKKGIVVWDEDGPTSSVIQVSTLDAATLTGATPARTISRPSADAESPRLAPRDGGGYWLAYIARGAGVAADDAGFVAEDVGFRWIEVVPLDANGSPVGAVRAATPKDGHVMVFDLAPAPDGAALVVYRAEESSTGAGGGQVMRAVVRPGAIDAPAVVAEDEVGAGAPTVLPGWIAVLSAAEVTRLAPLGPFGDLAAPLNAEPDIGSGEPIASSRNRLLVARPSGRAVKLVVLECRPESLPAEGRDR